MHTHPLACVIALLLTTFTLTATSTYDLPSAIQRSAVGDTVEAIGNGQNIWIRTQSQPEYTEVRLPESMYNEFLGRVFSDLELSASGRYLFIAVNGADGLYRYDVQNGTWTSARPPESSRSVSALTRGPDGTIYAGCGGYFQNSSSNQTGIYQSTDDGETWTTVKIVLEQGPLPGIVDIAVNGQGLMVFLGRRVPGSAQGGLYCQTKSGKWIAHYDATIGSVVAGDTTFYTRRPDLLQCFIPKDSVYSVKSLYRNGRMHSISRTDGDTLLLLRTQADSSLVNLVRVVDSTIIDVGEDLAFINDYESPFFWVSSVRPDSLYFSGTGHWAYHLESGEHRAVRLPTSRPWVNRLLGCEEYTYVKISQHRWHRLGPGLSTEPVDEVLARRLDLCTRKSTTRYSDKIHGWGGDVIYSISKDRVDSIATIPLKRTIEGIAVTLSEDMVYAYSRDTIFRLDRNSQAWEVVSTSGRPTYTNDGEEKLLGIDAIFLIRDSLYAWFRGDDYPVDHWDSGGLFRLQNGSWSRLPSNIPYRATAMMLASVLGTSGVFFAVERSGSSMVSDCIVRLDVEGERLLVESSGQHTIPYVLSVVASKDYVSWMTEYGKLHSWATAAPMEAMDLGSLATEINAMRDGLVVGTYHWGVQLIDHSDVISSVETEQSQVKNELSVHVISPDVWSLQLSTCTAQQHAYREYDLAGSLLFASSISVDQGRGRIHRTHRHSAGPILVQLQSAQAGCVHTVAVMP